MKLKRSCTCEKVKERVGKAKFDNQRLRLEITT